MKNPKVGEMKLCNQQWKHPKTMIKINGITKTPEEAAMKNPKEFF